MFRKLILLCFYVKKSSVEDRRPLVSSEKEGPEIKSKSIVKRGAQALFYVTKPGTVGPEIAHPPREPFSFKNLFAVKKSHIGVLFEDDAMVLIKSTHSGDALQLKEVLSFPFHKDESFFDNLKLTLLQVPKRFFKGAEIHLAFSSKHLTHQHFMMPNLDESEEAAFVKTQVPDMATSVWDYIKVGANDETGASQNEIIFFEIKENNFKGYTQAFAAAKLNLHYASADPIPLVSGIQNGLYQLENGNHLFLHLDMHHSYILRTDALGMIKKYRVIHIGFSQILHALQQPIKLDGKETSLDDAAARECLLNPDLFDEAKRNEDPFLEGAFSLIWPVIEKLTTELKNSVYILSHDTSTAPKFIHLSGDFCNLPGATNYFSAELKEPVNTIKMSTQTAEMLEEHPESSHLPICHGLALSAFKPTLYPVNLLPRKYLERKTRRMLYVVPTVVIVAFLAVATWVILSYTNSIKDMAQEVLKKEQLYASLRKKLPDNPAGKSREAFSEILKSAEGIRSEGLPIETLLYDLNKNRVYDLRLTSLSISKSKLRLEGNLVKKTMENTLTSFMDHLNTVPYLRAIQLELSSSDSYLATFQISASILPKGVSK